MYKRNQTFFWIKIHKIAQKTTFCELTNFFFVAAQRISQNKCLFCDKFMVQNFTDFSEGWCHDLFLGVRLFVSTDMFTNYFNIILMSLGRSDFLNIILRIDWILGP